MSKRQIKDNWLLEYLRYTANQESPDAFHMWVGLSVLATVLNREVWFNQGYFKIFPNQYVILVAGSQKCRKSVSIDIGRSLLDSLPQDKKPSIIAQKLTPEALIEALWPVPSINDKGVVKQTSSGLLVASELSVLIDKQARNSGLLAILVDLYDCQDRWSYKTKARGDEELNNVYCNLLAGSSPEYLRLSLPYDEIGGGMLARTIFVYQTAPRRREPFPEYGEAERRSKDRLIHDLLVMRETIHGEFEITKEAREWYKAWYIKVGTDITNPALAPYYNKKETHVLKLAQLISVAESDRGILDSVHLQMALKILEQNEKNLPLVMGELITSPTGHKSQQVLNAIAELYVLGKLPTRTNLLRKLYHVMDAEELTKAIDTLLAAGMLTESMGKRRGEIIYGLGETES